MSAGAAKRRGGASSAGAPTRRALRARTGEAGRAEHPAPGGRSPGAERGEARHGAVRGGLVVVARGASGSRTCEGLTPSDGTSPSGRRAWPRGTARGRTRRRATRADRPRARHGPIGRGGGCLSAGAAKRRAGASSAGARTRPAAPRAEREDRARRAPCARRAEPRGRAGARRSGLTARLRGRERRHCSWRARSGKTGRAEHPAPGGRSPGAERASERDGKRFPWGSARLPGLFHVEHGGPVRLPGGPHGAASEGSGRVTDARPSRPGRKPEV